MTPVWHVRQKATRLLTLAMGDPEDIQPGDIVRLIAFAEDTAADIEAMRARFIAAGALSVKVSQVAAARPAQTSMVEAIPDADGRPIEARVVLDELVEQLAAHRTDAHMVELRKLLSDTIGVEP